MKLVWKIVKVVIFGTGAWCWGSAIKHSINEYNEHKDDPLVKPLILM